MPVIDKGYKITSREEFINNMTTDMLTIFPDMSTSDQNALFVLIKTLADELNDADVHGMEQYNNQYILSASDVHLDRIVKLAGISRIADANSTGKIKITGTPNAQVPPNFRVGTVDGINFKTTSTVWTRLDGTGNLELEIISDEKGSNNNVNAGRITEILNPQAGISSVTNELAITGARDRESDPELRTRYFSVITNLAGSSLDSIKNKIISQTGATYANAKENVEDHEVDGLPPHSFEMFVAGGTDKDIAQTIFDNKPAGIKAHGTTIIDIPYGGETYHIGFSRANVKNYYFLIEIDVDSSRFDFATMPQQIKDNIKNYVNTGNKILRDRIISEIYNGSSGIIAIKVLRFDTVDPPVNEADVIGTVSDIFFTEDNKITINTNAV